jgi:isopentenyldiphosphate isomerase
VFVFNSAGRLLVQLRTAEKDEFPLCYTSSASGHVDSGEGYESAAVRELEEELGLSSPIEFLTKLPAGPLTANEHSALFRTVTDIEPVFDAVEILSGEYLPLREVMADIVADPDRYTPPFRELLDWYQQSTGGG